MRRAATSSASLPSWLRLCCVTCRKAALEIAAPQHAVGAIGRNGPIATQGTRIWSSQEALDAVFARLSAGSDHTAQPASKTTFLKPIETLIHKLHCHMMTWPKSVPPDLKKRLDEVLSFRTFGPAEVWGEVRDWLVAHGVEAPDKLPEDPPLDGRINL